MNILVFNCGSSSLKYTLIEMPGERELAGGEAQRVGPRTADPPRIIHRTEGKEVSIEVDMPDHGVAFEEIMKLLARNPEYSVDALGHRLVHGGAVFGEHAVVNEDVLSDLIAIQGLAPIHNPPATRLVEACKERQPGLPQVTVFDTAYHATIPDYACQYTLPRDVTGKLHLRKYGFHGTSHNYVAAEAATFLGKSLDELNAVSCHLGSGGASLCAIVNGKSVDNTMGFSPLQGLMMSTRSGDLDPAVALRLLDHAAGDAAAVEELLNKHSGVLGMSGFSADIRDVLARVRERGGKSDRLDLARQVYLWRIRKYLGAYLTIVGAPEAVIFTDTIGELVPDVRAAVCADMDAFGLRVDEKRNREAVELPADVAADDSSVRALVIHTNEELAIARHTYRILAGAAQP